MSSLRDRLRRQLGEPAKKTAAPQPDAPPEEPSANDAAEPSVGERLQRMFRASSAPPQSVRREGRRRSTMSAAQGGASLGSGPTFSPPSRLPRADPNRPPTHPPQLSRELRGDDTGAWFHCEARFPAGHLHGAMALDRVLEVDAAGAVVLSGDPRLSSFDPREAVFFDLETTGLMGGGGNLAFIVGIATVDEDGGVHLVQYLLREPGDEAALLEGLLPTLEAAKFLVSFNGKSFDRHVLADRFVMNRMSPDVVLDTPHLDLIHPARRLFRRSLASCSLSSLEEACLGVFRHDDMPGSEAPAAWFAWLRTGDGSAVRRVQDHNALDLLSLVTLTAHLDRCVQAPGAALPDPAALAQAGRLLVERGEIDRGEQVLQILTRGDAQDPVVYGAMHHLAEHLRRSGRHEEALPLWRRMRAAAGGQDLHPWRSEAVALEHRLDRAGEALDVVDELLARLANGDGFAAQDELDGLLHRQERLRRRTGLSA
ncbi:MAG: ribonuclease H-like domain-containing protein [Deltaproteobacteria bacterium]|nr:ribonuclease H-like domain-containing protein [Deltaproteobacteria bacterium]